MCWTSCKPAEATLLAPGKEGARRPGVAVADGFIGTFGDNSKATTGS
jgi:hypothetical protein